jgi:hypothetical protein
VDVELFETPPDIDIDRIGRNAQLGSEHLVGMPADHEAENLALALRKAHLPGQGLKDEVAAAKVSELAASMKLGDLPLVQLGGVVADAGGITAVASVGAEDRDGQSWPETLGPDVFGKGAFFGIARRHLLDLGPPEGQRAARGDARHRAAMDAVRLPVGLGPAGGPAKISDPDVRTKIDGAARWIIEIAEHLDADAGRVGFDRKLDLRQFSCHVQGAAEAVKRSGFRVR